MTNRPGTAAGWDWGAVLLGGKAWGKRQHLPAEGRIQRPFQLVCGRAMTVVCCLMGQCNKSSLVSYIIKNAGAMTGADLFFPSDHRSRNKQNSYAYAHEHEQSFSCPRVDLGKLWAKVFESKKYYHKKHLKLSAV